MGYYPPGTSKWNKIEHRMFSFISMNWREGFRIKAVLDKGRYETGSKISDEQKNQLNIKPHKQNPE